MQRYLAAGGWAPYRRRLGRPRKLAAHLTWLAERFRRNRGNADVVRQELEAELGVRVDLRTVEREVAPLRRELEAEARATVRFETPSGKPMQIDFGHCRVALTWGLLATLGLSTLLLSRHAVLPTVRVFGAVYLLYLCYKAFRSAALGRELKAGTAQGQGIASHFLQGLGIHLTNPKAILAWTTILAGVVTFVAIF